MSYRANMEYEDLQLHRHILRYDSETRMLSLGWVAEQAHTLLNCWQLCRNQRPNFEFFY